MRQEYKRKRIRKDKNISTEENNVKSFIISIIIIIVGLGLVYLFTLLAQKNGFFDEGYNKPETTTPSISYTNITAGTVFDREEDEYYVLFADSNSSEYIYLTSIISKYEEDDDHLPVYIVDLHSSFNKDIIGEENNTDASDSSELSIKDYALMKISDGDNDLFVDTLEEIEEELN